MRTPPRTPDERLLEAELKACEAQIAATAPEMVLAEQRAHAPGATAGSLARYRRLSGRMTYLRRDHGRLVAALSKAPVYQGIPKRG